MFIFSMYILQTGTCEAALVRLEEAEVEVEEDREEPPPSSMRTLLLQQRSRVQGPLQGLGPG